MATNCARPTASGLLFSEPQTRRASWNVSSCAGQKGSGEGEQRMQRNHTHTHTHCTAAATPTHLLVAGSSVGRAVKRVQGRGDGLDAELKSQRSRLELPGEPLLKRCVGYAESVAPVPKRAVVGRLNDGRHAADITHLGAPFELICPLPRPALPHRFSEHAARGGRRAELDAEVVRVAGAAPAAMRHGRPGGHGIGGVHPRWL